MSKSQDDDFDLAVLAKRLVVEGMPVQLVIAEEAGVSQSTVSRAVRGLIKQPSKGARRLWSYATARMAILREAQGSIGARSAHQRRSANRHADADGDSQGQRRTEGKQRARATPVPRRRSETNDTQPSAEDRQQLVDAAIAGLHEYLADSFDPRLVIEQLAVLRRAQDPSRWHRRKNDQNKRASE